MYPSDRKYTKDHEWVKIDGAQARVGITDYAQKQLGDVVYLELPDVGRASVERIRNSVVFPAPLGPSNPKICPRPTSNVTSSRARTVGCFRRV